MTTSYSEEADLLIITKICADSYSESKAENNSLKDTGWVKLNLYINGEISDKYYYDFNDISGFDAAIYYNESTGEIIIGIRGTEVDAGDGDVEESAKILNLDDNLTQFKQLKSFYQIVNATLKYYADNGYKINTEYKVVGQSLGGALASAYIQGDYITDEDIYHCTEAITINAIGVGYAYEQSDKVTNYLVMNDIFAMLSYDQQIGTIKLVFPIEIKNTADILSPHNDVIFDANEAQNFVNYVIEMDAADWSKEKGVSIWYYDKNNYLKYLESPIKNIFSYANKLLSILDDNINKVNFISQFISEITNIIQKSSKTIANYAEQCSSIADLVDKITNLLEENIPYLESKFDTIQDISNCINAMSSYVEDIAEEVYNSTDKLTSLSNILDTIKNNLTEIEDLSEDIISNIDKINNTILEYATEENLKAAIDTINQSIQETPHKLHYSTTSGDYIIGSDDYIYNDKIINIGIDNLNGSNNDDIIWGRGMTIQL